MVDSETSRRQRWLGVLAKARLEELEVAMGNLGDLPDCTMLRRPEIGLVMARGRAGGSGQRFNLGEIPVTRCAVQSPAGHVGHGYVQGRSKHHAELAATMDALLQDGERQSVLLSRVIDPLAEIADERKAATRRKAEATRVEFFTLVRGGG
ncbi:MAG: phosphonate C-P lyase system protein PhnG [Geminicoccaceae bacterium]